MYENETAKTVYRIFDSVDELTATCQNEIAPRQARAAEENHDLTRRSFLGRSFPDWDAALTAGREAWTPGLETLDRMLSDMADAELPAPKCRRRRTRFSEDNGDEVDYDRMRSGQAFWRSTHRDASTGPTTITIVVDVAAPWRPRFLRLLSATEMPPDIFGVLLQPPRYHPSVRPSPIQFPCRQGIPRLAPKPGPDRRGRHHR